MLASSWGYLETMSTLVNVSELKNHLSRYLRMVRQGNTIVIRDRDRVIARLEPAGAGDAPTDDESTLDALERAGTLRRGTGAAPNTWRAHQVEVTADVVGAVLAEREDGR